MIITIDTHDCSREELAELKEYLVEQSWDFTTDGEEEKDHKYLLMDSNEIYVCGSHSVKLAEKINEEDLYEYKIIHRESEIESLYQWISESKREDQKVLMKEDLHQLESIEDEYVLSSVSTNDFVSQDDDNFSELVEGLIEVNESL